MTSWFPGLWDTGAGILGAGNDWKFSGHYTRSGVGLLDNAAYSTVNKMLGVPGALLNTITGDVSGADISAIRTLPILGSWYGMSRVYDTMR